MEKLEKLDAYYQKEHPFREGIGVLRTLALQTDCMEEYKWNFPVYTINGKNVFGICRFKNHFGVWFFNGVFLSDPKNVLRNAQEGKTKGMRHWNFLSTTEIEKDAVLAYMLESIENQKQGKEIIAKKSTVSLEVPALLKTELSKKSNLKASFEALSPYKQKEYCEYIIEAKQEKTKIRRLEKILPMISKGIGLHDAYR
ncbi:YdeI/OmpD-associated family protein [Flagellimonas sp.]|uniref:YdeI/OmpD-associated family protein n=1 Tax=Flagellimonas sp. TaxID=2058762 RepID=UPI003B5C5206